MTLPRAIQEMADRTVQYEAIPKETAPVVEETVNTTETPIEETSIPNTPPPAETTPPSDIWEQRYKSFKGHADAELRRMQAETQKANAKAEELEKKFSELTQKLSDKEERDNYPEVTSEEEDAYGKDLLAVQEKIAKRVMLDARKVWDAERKALLERINELGSSIDSTKESVSKSKQDLFYEQLSLVVPDWETVNQDAGFHAWLAEEDQFTGIPKQAILNMAGERFDSKRVASIFNAYKASLSPSPAVNKQAELQRQVSPTKNKTATTHSPSADKKVWQQHEIQQFYHKLAHGQISHVDAQSIENEIHKAVAEGRVR